MPNYQTPQTIRGGRAGACRGGSASRCPWCSATRCARSGGGWCAPRDYARHHGLSGCAVDSPVNSPLVRGRDHIRSLSPPPGRSILPESVPTTSSPRTSRRRAPAEILQYAEIGLCSPGEGHLLVREGATELGGGWPVNVSGGLMSRGHPIGATRAAPQLVEIYDQLRAAGIGRFPGVHSVMAMNGGGWLNGAYAEPWRRS